MEDTNKMREQALEHVFVAMRATDWLREAGHLKTFVKGSGVRITDMEGKTFIDGAAGWQFGAVGHGRTEIADAVRDQMLDIAISAPEFTNIPEIKLATKIAELAPGDLNKVAFCNSGSEAVETGMRLAKEYHLHGGQQRKHKVIARRGSYHGWTWGAMTVNGARWLAFQDFEPLVPMGRFVTQPYCYRCDFNMEYPGCGVQCAKEIETVIKFENPETVSAVIGEPVSHSTPAAVPPPEYWPMVREICDKYDVLLINDEVITGFGRTGKWFACMNWNIVPDIITFAKQVTSGYVPMGGAITTKRVAAKFEGGDDKKYFQISTFGGNPSSSVAALTNVGIIEREGLVQNSAEVGKYLLDGLQGLRKSPIVGDVRGLGLFCAVEMVADKTTKAHFENEKQVSDKITHALEQEGLLARAFGTTVVFTPPLCLSKSDAEEIVGIMERVVSAVAKGEGY